MSTTTGDASTLHEAAVRARVQAALNSGHTALNEVLAFCEGADPVEVATILAATNLSAPSQKHGGVRTPESLSALAPRMPAPDPARSQWWFSSAGVANLMAVVESRLPLFDEVRIFSLGTPTLAPYLAHKDCSLDVLDSDNQVLDVIKPLINGSNVHSYDASDPLPTDLADSFQLAVLDPPWYPDAIYTFINRALTALVTNGEILCTLPGRLTRPGIETFRSNLIKDLVESGHEILATQPGKVRYQVPRFELAALEHLDNFTSIPWRSGDLLHVRKDSGNLLPHRDLQKRQIKIFSRNPTEFRIFVGNSAQAKSVKVVALPDYAQSISTRAVVGQEPDVWSTEKKGIQTCSPGHIEVVLRSWSNGETLDAAQGRLADECGCETDEAIDTVVKLDDVFKLWTNFAGHPPLRLSEDLQRAREAAFSDYATKPSARKHHEQADPFRGEFQRDRDRILWSAGLRRLSNKTQLFPVQHDDDLRQRLTHSIEVAQLASTIGASFGLDGDLIEAGALAHDIGHTPFGHAGENALDKLMTAVSTELPGFNHYEHGIDVLRYLEGPYYASPTLQFSGLNLTPELSECVFKHTYCHNEGRVSSEELLARSKHGDLVEAGYCHLEGQAVRVADKIAYLISDLEDGIRLGAISQGDLLRCRFFHRPPLDFQSDKTTSLFDRFRDQRRWILKILMEDVLHSSNKRLARLSSKSAAGVRDAGEYTINHSEEVAHEVGQIWRELQAGRLHMDSRVQSANLHAARVVSELAISYSILPNLIDDRFREEHKRLHQHDYLKYYRTLVGDKVTLPKEMFAFLPVHLVIGVEHQPGTDAVIPTEHLIQAKDYVAALSDTRARQLHRELSDGHWFR